MGKLLLDTDILSGYLKGHDRNVIRRASEYARENGVFTFTSVTVHEIVFGLELKNAARQAQKALAWLNRNEQITPTADDYLDAAIIKASARKQGSTVELADSLIAAMAIRLALPLVTGNTGFPGHSKDRRRAANPELARGLNGRSTALNSARNAGEQQQGN